MPCQFPIRRGGARLNSKGILDTTFPGPDVRTVASNAFVRTVYATAPQHPGRIVIGGAIGAVQGSTRAGVEVHNG